MQKTANNTVVSILKELAGDFYSEKEQPLKNVLLVGVQHILATTVDMLKVMKDFGLREAFIGGKHYSTHEDSAQEIKKLGFEYIDGYPQLSYGGFHTHMQWVIYSIWSKALKRLTTRQFDLLIILDDGADLLLSTPGILFTEQFKNKPKAIIGIEQTNGGANTTGFKGLPFSIINVAGTYVKKRIEYPHLANLITKRVVKLIETEVSTNIKHSPIIGILGYGNMGQTMTDALNKKGFRVIVYEKEFKKRLKIKNTHYPELANVLTEADIIIGCTGKNIIDYDNELPILLNSIKNKWLISTSSKDIEFYNLLTYIQDSTKKPQQLPNTLADINYKNKQGATIKIIRGGFPVNFDNGSHSLCPDKIWTTRAALLLATLYASSSDEHIQTVLSKAEIWSLPVKLQVAILKKYVKLNPQDYYVRDLLSHEAKLIELVLKNSIGSFVQVNKNHQILREVVMEEAFAV
jgi:S-adenosylhomocysteine hydrolase